MLKVLTIEKITQRIRNYKGVVVICGCSLRTKEIVEKDNLQNYIDYVFDNDISKLNTKFVSVEVINQQLLETLKNPLIIILTNHTLSFYKQVKSISPTMILIEKKKQLSKIQNISRLLDNEFTFEIETPTYMLTDSPNNSNKFVPILTEALLTLHKKIVIFRDIGYFKERVIKKNSLLFSYHSVGSKGHNIFRYKDAYLDNMITFDSIGYSGWSSLCNKDVNKILETIPQEKANKFFDKFAKKNIAKNKSKYKQPYLKDFKFPNKFIFFPLQTTDDSVMLHSYFKPIELIEKIINLLSKKNIKLVIKRHPRCKDLELKRLLKYYEKKNKVIIFEGSIHDAISKAETVYTINSGVGFEALLHLKPVITFGKSDYMSMTKNVKDLDTIKKNSIYKLDYIKIDEIKRFIYYFIHKKSFFLNDEVKINKLIYSFIKNYLIKER